MAETRADLPVVAEFLNTLDERTFIRRGRSQGGTDELASVEGWLAWLDAHGLVENGRDARQSDLAAAVALRTALRDSLAGGPASPEMLADFPLRLSPGSDGRLRIAGDSDVHALNVIVETVATSIATGAWSRLKLCASPDCHWAFYDSSRNGGGRWCSMEVCGNRQKTRAYRQRHVD